MLPQFQRKTEEIRFSRARRVAYLYRHIECTKYNERNEISGWNRLTDQ